MYHTYSVAGMSRLWRYRYARPMALPMYHAYGVPDTLQSLPYQYSTPPAYPEGSMSTHALKYKPVGLKYRKPEITLRFG